MEPAESINRGKMKRDMKIMDGAIGTMLRRRQTDITGILPCDIMNLEASDIVRGLHLEYLEAGCDIITTNTFNSNRLSLPKPYSYECAAIAERGARIAKEAREIYRERGGGKDILIAGSMGPTPIMLSRERKQSEKFQILRTAYKEQAAALIAGGADILYLETVTDLLNARAAIEVFKEIEKERHEAIPFIMTATPTDPDGTLISGHSLKDLVILAEEKEALAIGFNCGNGTTDALELTRKLTSLSRLPVVLKFNAGLPDAEGWYPEDEQTFSTRMRECAEIEGVKITGGCCGTTPEYIRRLASALNRQTI